MISNNTIRNCTRPFPAIQGLLNEHTLGKILIKNVYQAWNGESIVDIKQKHTDNPYTLRIGTPSTDKQLKGDAIYFILHYLAYNPLTKDIERREIVPLRNMEKVYIGQSLDEGLYKDYRLFVDGNAVVDDIFLKNYEQLKDTSLGRLLVTLLDRTEKMQLEIAKLKRELDSKHIYIQDTLKNE